MIDHVLTRGDHVPPSGDRPVEPAIRVGFVLHVMQVAGAEVLVAETIRRLGGAVEPVVLYLDGVGQLGEQMRYYARYQDAVAILRRQHGYPLAVHA